MGRGYAAGLLAYIDRLARRQMSGERSDAQLLAAFDAGEAEAFEELVRRHGRLVYAACQRILGDSADIEDAFQATFLVLSRKAGARGWHASIAGWLYDVACRTSRKLRGSTERRRRREEYVARQAPHTSDARPPPSDLRELLDDELGRLPENYRLPIVLCYLEGQTNAKAASLLGCSESTIRGRLSRARDLLRFRLERRGLAVSVVVLGTLLEQQSLAAVPPGVAATTVEGVHAFAAGIPTTLASASAAALAKGVLNDMAIRKLKWAAAITAIALTSGIGTGIGVARTVAPTSPDAGMTLLAPDPKPEAKPQPKPAPPKDPFTVTDVDTGITVRVRPDGKSVEATNRNNELVWKWIGISPKSQSVVRQIHLHEGRVWVNCSADKPGAGEPFYEIDLQSGKLLRQQLNFPK